MNMSTDRGEDYGGLQQPTPVYAAFQQGSAPAGSIAKQSGTPSPAPARAKPAKPKTQPKPQPLKVRIRVDDMDGSLATNGVILDQVAGLFKAAGVDVEISYGKFKQRELEFDGVIPVLIVSEPTTTDQDERWAAIQGAMNLEVLYPPSTLANELPPPSSTGSTIREIVGSTRTLSTSGTRPVNLLHAPVVISVGRLLKAIKAKVPQKFANQVFVNELSATIAHECGHAFGLVISAKGGADKHPSDPRNVMSRDTFDSLGGINSLPTGEANWEKLLKGYQLPAFTNADVKAMHGAIKELSLIHI